MLSEGVKILSKALSPLVGGAGKEISGYLADQIRFYRWRSAVKILHRAKEFCEKEKIDPNSVPVKFIVPFLEASSMEDVSRDKKISDMWASLLASAVTSFESQQIVYIDVLKKLSSKDASFLIWLFAKLRSQRIYWEEDELDIDLCNVSDKIEVIDDFTSAIQERGYGILENAEKATFPADLIAKISADCAGEANWRVDIIPLRYGLSFFQDGAMRHTQSGPSNEDLDLNCVRNLLSLGIMEKFETSVWYPHRPGKHDQAIRAVSSYACLTSFGFDFMRVCLKNRATKVRKKKTTKRLML